MKHAVHNQHKATLISQPNSLFAVEGPASCSMLQCVRGSSTFVVDPYQDNLNQGLCISYTHKDMQQAGM